MRTWGLPLTTLGGVDLASRPQSMDEPRLRRLAFNGKPMASIAWQFVLCVLVADFITGVVHWWEDCYGLPTWPILGKLVIEPNIDHHRNPGLMGHMTGIVTRNYQSVLLFAAVAIVAHAFGLLCWQLVAVGVVASFGNEVHLWSHRGGNRFVKFLQDACLIQRPEQHAKHHKAPFDAYYCTLTNLTNAVLERVRFWRLAEAFVALFGVRPNRMSAARDFL